MMDKDSVRMISAVHAPKIPDGTLKLVIIHPSEIFPKITLGKEIACATGNVEQFKELYQAVASVLVEFGVLDDQPNLGDEILDDDENYEEDDD